MKTHLANPGVGATWSPVRLALVASLVLLPLPRQLYAGETTVVRTRERSPSVSVKPVVFLSLREYVATITAASPKIIAARLDTAAAYSQARSTYAGYLPSLFFNSGVGYNLWTHGRYC